MIEVKDLYLKYKIKDNKTKIVLNNINIIFPSKGFVFIIGKSGSGKSSLLNLMEGYLKPTSGYIKFNNKNINDSGFEKEKYYSNSGVLFQDFNLINDLTLKENIELLSDDSEKINELLNKYDLYKVRNNRIYELSGGEKQRCALIRMLIKDPSIIFADEPTGALDSLNGNKLMDDLYEISKHKLVIVVKHNEDFINKYKCFFVKLEEGKIIDSNLNNIKNNESKECNFTSKLKENISLLSKKVIFSNIKLSFFSMISLIFSYTILIFSLSFKTSFSSYSSSIINKYYSNNIFVCSKIISKNNGSYLKVTKKEKPKSEELIDLLSDDNITYKLLPNLSFFLNINEVSIDNNKFSNIVFSPTINNDLIENEVIINKEFKEKYNLNKDDLINVKINKTYDFYLKDSNDIFKENINLDLFFKIKDVYNEFPFLNSPKIYYNYEYFYDILRNKSANTISLVLDQNLSLLDLYNFSSSNQEIDSYSSYLYSNDVSKIISEEFQSKLKKNNFEIQNEAYIMSSSFLQIEKSIELALVLFNVIIFLTSLILLIFINISIVSESKKDLAILFSLGFNQKRMILPYFIKDFLTFIFSFIGSYLIDIFLIKKINSLVLKKYALDFSINLNLLNIAFVFLISLLVILLISIFIIKYFKNISIYKELKEE